MRINFALRFLALAFVFAFAFACVARADITGTIKGTVVDASGAAVPQATVIITNTLTGVVRTVTTESDGSFTVLQLAVGTYDLSIQKEGFKLFRQNGITLNVNQIYVVSAKLEIGSTTQTVEVSANPAQVETTTIQRGETIQSNEFKDLPLLNRNWVTLIQSVPGVVASSDRFGSAVSSSGNRTQSNDYMVNGGDTNDFALNTPLEIPNPDAIQEVQLITSTLNPEYGRNSGATLNAVSKAGTNQFHGDAWEYYRDTFMNSRNFFSAASVPPFHQNQFGGDLGGPAIKNKLFAFFSYQGTRTFSGRARNTHVFTNAERTGDWSAFLAAKRATFSSANKNPFALFGDSGSPCPAGVSPTPCPAGTATFAQLFGRTGKIPTVDLTLNPNSALANSLMVFVPPATINGTSAVRGNFLFNELTPSRTNQYIGRLDYDIRSKDMLYFYVFTQPVSSSDTLPFIGANLPGFGTVSSNNQYQYLVNETHIFNSNTINEIRFQYQRLGFAAVEPAKIVTPSSLGFSINPQNPQAGAPFIGVTGLFNLGFSQDGPQPRVDDNGQLADNFSVIRNNHSYKVGIDFRRNHSASPFSFENNGNFAFAGFGPFSTGVPGADFQLGIPLGYFQTSGGFEDARNWEYYSFIQDQWKIIPSLTFTYGAGWDVQTPLVDHANGCLSIAAFRPGEQSQVFPTSPIGYVFPGDPNVKCSGQTTHMQNVAPRLGFAWAPTTKFSVRTGWGIYYNSVEAENTLQFLTDPPFSLPSFGVTSGSAAPSFVNPYSNIDGSGTVANPFPYPVPKVGASPNFAQFEPMTPTVIDPNYNLPYNMNYNLTVEYQLPSNMIASVGYVGSEGRRLEGVVELNPLNPAVCLASPACLANVGATGESLTPGIGTAYNAAVIGSIGQLGTFLGSNYNSLQTSLQKALSHGLTFRAAYTWSHALDNSSSFEDAAGLIPPSNYRLVYGNSAYDAQHRFVISYDYAVPSIHDHLSWVPRRFAEGWRVAGVTTMQTGFPITLTEADGASLQCNPGLTDFGCWDRPNVVGPLQILDPRAPAHAWFNTASFASETLGVLGNAGRNSFHGPGINDWDISVIKNTTITEKATFQMRMDLFNAWNHAQFSNPDGNITDGPGAFGVITSTRIPGRIAQLAAKISF